MDGSDNPAENILDALRKNGWGKGQSVSKDGAICVGHACEWSMMSMDKTLGALLPVLNEQFPERLNWMHYKIGLGPVVAFNDHPDTTFADVERVLEKAAIRWEEGRVLRHD